MKNARLGGIIDARSSDAIRGLRASILGLGPENSLLDAIFASFFGVALKLPRLPNSHAFAGCHMPDIDADRDGLEAFCDSNPQDDRVAVDTCIDGDGSIFHDETDALGNVTKHCTEFVDAHGEPRFVDGISILVKFETTPAMLGRGP